jgi:hypothetical protein
MATGLEWPGILDRPYLKHRKHFGAIRSHLRLFALHRAHALGDTLYDVAPGWTLGATGSLGNGAGYSHGLLSLHSWWN